MKVLCSEGLASHTGPEPCVGPREGSGEASAGDRAGRPLSRERAIVPGANPSYHDGKGLHLNSEGIRVWQTALTTILDPWRSF